MKTYLVSYSTKEFYQRHKELNASAKQYGITNIISYSDRDLKKSEFYKKNKGILDNDKGAGFWLWKPYYINKALNKIKDSDILFYVDAASLFIDYPNELIKVALESEKGIITFDARPLTNNQFCRRDSFINIGCDREEIWKSWHTIATILIIKKTEFSTFFIKEWLRECQNPYSIVNNNYCDQFTTFEKELTGFIDHRSDQSILSILVSKFKLETFRNPTVWGNYLKMEEFRKPGEEIVYPYLLENSIFNYSEYPMSNSPYGTIFQINRGVDPKKKQSKIQHFINKIIKCIFLKLFFKTKKKIPPPTSQCKAKYSFSQCGEDRIIQYIFGLRGIYKPSYIDIGAHDPFFLSNTALFYESGSRGINVEANPKFAANFKNHRPNDINLNIGIGSIEAELDFYIMEDNSLSTFSKHEADSLILLGKGLAEVKKIKLTTITKVLDQYCKGQFPDFMSLDVEGFDLQILQSIDFEKSFPKVICVEAAEYSPIGVGIRRNDLIDFLVSKGYYEYANTNLNSIMVKNEFWFI